MLPNKYQMDRITSGFILGSITCLMGSLSLTNPNKPLYYMGGSFLFGFVVGLINPINYPAWRQII